MKRVASSLGHASFLPTPDELKEIGRRDLVRAIAENGGHRASAKLCNLRPQKSVKRAEKPLKVVGSGFEPYPFRRLSKELSEMINDLTIRFEIRLDAKIGRGHVEEYGFWVFRTCDLTSTLGRVGWIRRRPGSPDLWLHRLEGDARWTGMFKDSSKGEALTAILVGAKLYQV